MGNETLQLRVTTVEKAAEGIHAYTLVEPDGRPLPSFEAGAHLDLMLPSGLVRQYSLCNSPRETHRYVIAVQREAQGRGGSRWMHDEVRAGDVLRASAPRNQFRLLPAERYLLIAGGIGITPLLSMMHALVHSNADFQLHYCTRSPERTAFRHMLSAAPFARHVTFHHDGGNPSQGLNIRALLSTAQPGARLYYCGPTAFMEAVHNAASAVWAPDRIHFESFTAPPVDASRNTAFDVVVQSSGASFHVSPEKTLLQALREGGVNIPSSCEQGLCGTCTVGLFDGEADHRDQILSEAEKTSNVSIVPCVSRARRGSRLVIDL